MSGIPVGSRRHQGLLRQPLPNQFKTEAQPNSRSLRNGLASMARHEAQIWILLDKSTFGSGDWRVVFLISADAQQKQPPASRSLRHDLSSVGRAALSVDRRRRLRRRRQTKRLHPPAAVFLNSRIDRVESPLSLSNFEC